MGERRRELRRRFHRKKKMSKLKLRLMTATAPADREKLIGKIKALSPEWVEPQPTA
jgi:lysylphosphatidylglycerol synthetase-like protein (DUF2156 family)